MRSKVKRLVRTGGLKVLGPILRRIDRQNELIRLVAKENQKTRAMVKQQQGQPINVLFVCHEPSLWSMFDSVYRAMVDDPEFNPMVVALPYRHSSLPQGKYKDAGMVVFLEKRGILVVRGYEEDSGRWMRPAEFSPDYIFFQTPYDLFPPEWCVEHASLIARVCYIPYGTSISQGQIENIIHPSSFFKYVSLFIMESVFTRNLFVTQLKSRQWFNRDSVLVGGCPKFDYLANAPVSLGNSWRRGLAEGVMRILWTPRWNTGEGHCHFFDYKDFFGSFCRANQDVDFVLRPHPLCFQNFISTREMTCEEVGKMEVDYRESANMVIHQKGDYQDLLLTCDIFVSDLSSMLLEYLATGKPIIYTHRKNVFNSLGQELARGAYWVETEKELAAVLMRLKGGDDPLRENRKLIKDKILYLPKGGACARIKELLRLDFSEFNKGV
jgi:CDP-Glycerol:Poly(glycerophosphate) glycerophosphotransferase